MKRVLQLIVLTGLLSCVNGFGFTARELLVSPWQRQRDMAAGVLQNTYKAPPRAHWDELVDSLKLGMKQSAVENLVESFNAVPTEGAPTNRYFVSYRLDDLWVLSC